ncbi:MAG TPA: SDR family NAD(P)-dependent oxidoreductase [Gemmatimonadaceae bacterium]|nr:SDR family NAD(P)-dependent oxidoreductase [Vicinamibacterales bacterium]
METQRRIALVTGANRGMGLETARQLLRRGLRVVLTGRDEDATERARLALGDPGRDAISVRMDVTDAASIDAAKRSIERQLGPVDVVVNNAAVLLNEHDEVLSIPLEAFRTTLDTNLLGAIEVCRAFVPSMIDRGYGRVVNVSSGAGQMSRLSTYAPAYSISKVALNAFTRILADTYRESGILVNAVDPGWVRTDMGGSGAPRSIERGVETTVWLATLDDDGPTGGFFKDRRQIEW